MRTVSLPSIAGLLARYRERYRWVDLFSVDVDFAKAGSTLHKISDTHFRARVKDKRLDITFFPDRGVARFELVEKRDAPGSPVVDAAALGALSGAAVAAIAARKADTSGLVFGLLVGGLLGAAIGAAKEADSSRVMTLQYDPASDDWRVYHGPLQSWAKHALKPG